MLAVDWANLQVASAFVLGGVLGAIATIRIMRAILQTFGRYAPHLFRDAKEPRPPTPEGEGERGSE